MSYRKTNLRRSLALSMLPVLALGMAGSLRADPPYYAPGGSYYPPGPVIVAPPPTYSYYPPPLPAAPLSYSNNYSFYTTPKVIYTPPTFGSPVPSFATQNTYYETDLLAPYTHTSGYQSYYKSQALSPILPESTVPKSTSPYYSPKFFRY